MIRKIPTSNMSKEEWTSLRASTIGGSDAAAILGLNPYKSAYALWMEKTGKVVPEDISGKEAVRLGNDLEDYVAKRFTEATGKKVRRENNTIFRDDMPFAHANYDRLVVGEKAGLEIKTTNALTEEVVVNFIEDEVEREKQPIIGYVGYYRLVNGAEKTIYMSKAAIEAHERKFRKGEYQGKGWRDDWDAMARKTVYRQLIGKWGVMSIDYQTRDEGKQLADVMAEDAKAEDGLGNIIDTDIVADQQTGEVIPQEVADNA